MITKGYLLDNKFFKTKVYREYSVSTAFKLAGNKSKRLFSNLCKLTKDIYLQDNRIIPICTALQDNRIRYVPRYMLPDIMKPWMDKYKIYLSINTNINGNGRLNVSEIAKLDINENERMSICESTSLIIEVSAWSPHKKIKPYIFKYLQNFITCYLKYLSTDKTKSFESFLKEYNFLEHKCHKRFLQKTILI
jgi:hypothetical protein